MSAAEPLLIPHADADGSLCGYLRVCERDFALRIVPACPPTPARLDGCRALRSTLAGHEAALQQWLRSCTSPDEFLVELRDLLERLLRAQPAPAPLTTSSFYEQLMTELDGVGWSALRNISPSFDRLELELLDEAQRAHVLHLSLPSDYPASPPRAEVALPAPFELQWAAEQQRFSVRGAMLQFEAALGRHQLLWDMLDDLDAHTWVLEPQHPTRDCAVRRLAIGQHCSLQLGLHVSSPASLPTLQFLGAEKSLVGYRSALNARLALWRPERSVRLNLEAVLDVKFPSSQKVRAPFPSSRSRSVSSDL